MIAEEAARRRRMSPRRRASVIRIVQYAVLVALVGWAAVAADWPKVGATFFAGEDIAATVTGGLGAALGRTLLYTAGAFVFGLVLGTTLALMRLSQVGPYRWMATCYIEFFRGLPALLVLIAVGSLPIAFAEMEIPFGTTGMVWLGLGLVAAAYIAETIRAGIEAVPVGQREAARSLGMSPTATMVKVVLPQAFRINLPPLTNEVILLIKDSSLVNVLGLAADEVELTKFGREMTNQVQGQGMTPLVVAGFSYLAITLPLTFLVRRMERRTGQGRRS